MMVNDGETERVCMCVYVSVWVCAPVCVHYVLVSALVCICMYAHLYVYMYVCMCVLVMNK